MKPLDVGRYESLDQKPYGSLYLYVDTIIDHPVEKVWPHALDIGGWMSAHQLETLAGEPASVGYFERVSPRGLGPEVPRPHYHLYGIAKIIPLKLIVLEVFPEKGGSYGHTREWVSFDSILLTDLGQRTQVVFHMVDIHVGQDDPDFHARRKREVEAGQTLIEEYFENLNRLVEKS